MNGFMLMWLIFAVVFLVLELSTVSLVSIWFVAGAVCALVAAAFELSIGVQIGVFIVATAVLLILTKPAVKKYIHKETEATNFDRVIGQEGIVTEKIDSVEGSGQVKVLGSVWSAKSEDGSEIAEGEKVEVVSVEGVKAVVKRK